MVVGEWKSGEGKVVEGYYKKKKLTWNSKHHVHV